MRLNRLFIIYNSFYVCTHIPSESVMVLGWAGVIRSNNYGFLYGTRPISGTTCNLYPFQGDAIIFKNRIGAEEHP